MGRKGTTGKYDTREELIHNVNFFYYQTNQTQAQVARTCGVLETVVKGILQTRKKNNGK